MITPGTMRSGKLAVDKLAVEKLASENAGSAASSPAPLGRKWDTFVVVVIGGLWFSAVLIDHRWPGLAGLTWVRALLGAYLVAVFPIKKLVAADPWRNANLLARWCYASGSWVLLLITVGLVLNTTLPWVGIARPLDPIPVGISLLLGLLALHRWAPASNRAIASVGLDAGLRMGAVAVVITATVGAIRLNNGASAGVSLLSLACGGLVWALLLWKHDELRPGTIGLALYGLGLALLLMTALRGWGITGHDIQREFERLELVYQNGFWSMAAFRDPYNACLSITILPAMLANVTGLSPVLVLKVVPQLIFALSPVLIYVISRKFLNGRTSVLAALLFCCFPTYFNDLPFLGRQSIAFIFLGLALYPIADRAATRSSAQLQFLVFGSGVVVSHYATTYVLLAVLLVALLVRCLAIPVERLRGSGRIAFHVITARSVLLLFGMTFLWSQVVTDSNSQLATTVRSSFTRLIEGGNSAAKSADTNYSILGGEQVTADQRIADYRAASLERTSAARARGEFLPEAEVDRAATPVVPEAVMPLTDLGKKLDQVTDVKRTHEIMRALAARAFQLFIFIGLVGFLINSSRRSKLSLEWFALAVGSLLAVVSQVILPQISVDYGVLRAFAQSLFVLAPFLAFGVVLCARLARQAAPAVCGAMGLVLYGSLTGLLPQLTGGYAPQLYLNNSGRYFDLYYSHPGDAAAGKWLKQQMKAGDTRPIDMDTFTRSRLYGLSKKGAESGNFPTEIRQDSFVVLGYAGATSRIVTISESGDLIAYRYPVDLLLQQKNLRYSNGTTQIFG